MSQRLVNGPQSLCSNCYFRTRKKKMKRLTIIIPLTLCVILVMYLRSEVGLDELDTDTVVVAGRYSRGLLEMSSNMTEKGSNFPPDLFTEEQRKQGAVVFHIFGLVYMFIALAVVCDEFFIPALDVITEKMGISEDVAGATFMAAGGSAPELFTSIIGVFISLDDVGIGTIVGSAVFNILFVISMCAIFSKTVLVLTWWPLFRDVTFYSLILISLMLCFRDSQIHWYESLFLLSWYGGYVTFMKYNSNVEKALKRLVNRAKVNGISNQTTNANGDSTVATIPDLPLLNRRVSMPILHGGSSKFRQGVLQLMIHSVDPLHEEILQSQAKNAGSRPESSAEKSTALAAQHHTHPPGATECPLCADGLPTVNGDLVGDHDESNNNPAVEDEGNKGYRIQLAQGSVESDKDIEEPLDMSWPALWYKKITYIVLFPIIMPLWLTLPDVRRPEKRKYFAGSFIGSILWIAFYSYLMVWWATLVGETFGMPSEIMGLTFLAAGTSIPDLITSVLVARKGLGDMAVSSSVGSNIFDVTVGLPLPWFIYSCIYGTVTVNSGGMACSIMILFIMLLFVIITIAAFNWRLNVGMAFVMFFLYFVFIVLSLLLEKGVIKCASIINFF